MKQIYLNYVKAAAILLLVPAVIIALLVFGESIYEKFKGDKISEPTDNSFSANHVRQGIPLMIFDGEEIQTLDDVDLLKTEIEILKNEEAVKRYGKKGENGAIIINSKKTQESFLHLPI
ncbi:MAG: hypothetical protein LBH32_11755 [Dysgonamonadaceae bacterium]|jgi:hypothetical protein|nr:hypothetical protein [Dysgonamonadaceae bacterium]